jgi:hypothetical protein
MVKQELENIMSDQLSLDSPRMMLRGFSPLNSVCQVKSPCLKPSHINFPQLCTMVVPLIVTKLVKKQEYFVANLRCPKENTERDFNLLFQHMIFLPL